MKVSTVISIVGVMLIIAGGAWYLTNRVNTDPTFIIEGQSVTLTNGRAETLDTAGSASKVVTQYFGNVAVGDVSGDSLPDVAFIITQDRGGSGTFYYVVATLSTAAGGLQGTNAVLLGDRIAPQTTEIRDGVLIVNYAERKPSEPMTAQPSVGVSKYLKVENGVLGEAPR